MPSQGGTHGRTDRSAEGAVDGRNGSDASDGGRNEAKNLEPGTKHRADKNAEGRYHQRNSTSLQGAAPGLDSRLTRGWQGVNARVMMTPSTEPGDDKIMASCARVPAARIGHESVM
jgi:hypothetical protein